ncbi:SMP-30/Gluconolaconase/LRE-like region [Cordyceps javanica]|uniref:SMP-30/Gluconolaconase/LRE-like region n=1 Tax=Cordyceps javanica TaxID=43265 RepID=A0A545W8F7_9HYPO|nr:SMP-30/Gluconolaconase/LRE-like region [Cordyceps javanica]TQW10283.1 SMP-30/Gluconolaconase/LRE-like region [Cordyceps javanica]
MDSIQEWTVTSPWAEPHCDLGEGPFYEAETDSLRLVDIKKKQILYYRCVSAPASAHAAAVAPEVVQLDVCPTVTADLDGVDPRERIVVGVKHGLATLDVRGAEGRYEMLVPFREPPNERLRANDGCADPLGRFLLASMTDFGYGPCQPEGGLFLFTRDSAREIISELTIPNGVGWSPDRRTMYVTHSTARELLAFDYDPAAGGAMSNRRVHRRHESGPAEPDGLRVDVDGHVWQALYGEGAVLRIDGRSGAVLGRVRIPTRNATCVQFVDEDLFITTAADEDGPDPESRRLGGAIFRVHVGVRGLDLFKFKI